MLTLTYTLKQLLNLSLPKFRIKWWLIQHYTRLLSNEILSTFMNVPLAHWLAQTKPIREFIKRCRPIDWCCPILMYCRKSGNTGQKTSHVKHRLKMLLWRTNLFPECAPKIKFISLHSSTLRHTCTLSHTHTFTLKHNDWHRSPQTVASIHNRVHAVSSGPAWDAARWKYQTDVLEQTGMHARQWQEERRAQWERDILYIHIYYRSGINLFWPGLLTWGQIEGFDLFVVLSKLSNINDMSIVGWAHLGYCYAALLSQFLFGLFAWIRVTKMWVKVLVQDLCGLLAEVPPFPSEIKGWMQLKTIRRTE